MIDQRHQKSIMDNREEMQNGKAHCSLNSTPSDNCHKETPKMTASKRNIKQTQTFQNQKDISSRPKHTESSDRTSSHSQCEEHSVHRKVRNMFTTSSINVCIILLSTVIGVLSLALIVNVSNSAQGREHVAHLLESLHNHGYSSKLHPRINKHEYGSPDLFTPESKHELAVRLLHRGVNKRNVEEDPDENDALVKAGEATFMTIDVSGVKSKAQDGDEEFVVVFDAGSTGTRVHIYRFHFQDNGVQLVKEVYRWKKPGLSDFVQKPDEVAAYLQPLLDVAMTTVPASLHSSTRLVFKATAGLRLLNSKDAEMLLQMVRNLLSLTDFDFDPLDVNILGGTKEGLFGWITINYLLGNLDGSSVTAAALDLGGGSLQITYKPQHLAHFRDPDNDVGLLELFGEGYDLYTHSYLGQGLKAVRNSTLLENSDGTYTSYCLPVGYSGIFTYEGVDYPVRGPGWPSQDECWKRVGQFLSQSAMEAPWDFVGNNQHPDIYLFSYFYEILQIAGVIGNKENEKILTVEDIYHTAYKACHQKDENPSHPFLCQDLTYMSRLLGETFMLWRNSLHVVEEIKSGEVSWSLGAALDALSRNHSEE